MTAKPWIQTYLGCFAVVLAPVGEEFFFRGLLFHAVARFRLRFLVRSARRSGHPGLAWFLRQRILEPDGLVGVSFLFALFHVNAPTFLPLFAFALVLTWLCQKTDGLLAPIMAHGLFNLFNLGMLLVAEKYYHVTT